MDTGMLIGSRMVKGEGEGDAVVNARTGETIVTIPEATPAQVDAAVAAADGAFRKWSRTTPAERSGLLLKLADRIEQHADELATLEAQNCGKPRHAVLRDETRGIELDWPFDAAAVSRFLAGA